MLRWFQTTTSRLTVAALAVAAALLVRLSLAAWLENTSPYVLFFPAILAAGLLGGRIAGVASTFLAALTVLLLFFPLADAALFSRETSSLAAFLAGGLLVSFPAGAAHHYLLDALTRTGESLRRAAQLESLLASASVGFACFDRQRRVVRVNPTLATLRGVPEEKLLGQAIDAVLPGGPAAGNLLDQVFGSGQAVVGQEWAEGNERGWLLSLYPVRPAGGAGPVEMVGLVVIDISQRRRQEDELRSRADELTENERRKDVFLAMLSHELRNPLAALRSATELLTLGEPARPEVVALFRRQMGILTRLVDDLLDTARVSRGQIELRRHTVSVPEVVESAIETVLPMLESNGHRVETNLPSRPVMVRGDAVRLTQALANLLHNAARYTPPGGRITVRVEAVGNEAVVRVTDTGIGIRPEMLGRIFELFQQGDRPPGQVNEGLGLGLTLVRRLVELHGGSVTASSPGPGRGSTFEVRLPMLPTITDPTPHPPSLPPRDGGLRVLIVDDNNDAAESLSLLLQVKGHEVRVVHDGPAALEEVSGWRPGVVFLDIGLPGLDGFEVARLMREKLASATPRLIALTGFGHENDRKRGREVGFDEFLVKPAGPDELAQAMQPTV